MIAFKPLRRGLAATALLGGLAGAACAQNAPGNFGLKDGDRVVFYGDSITDQRQYTVFVENYVVTRFPKMKVDFVHSGWGGDTTTGSGGGPIDLRVQRDVLAYKPTVMTIMLGMNDAGYRPFVQDRFDAYTTGYTHILDSVRQSLPNVRYTLIQPSPYDDVTRAPGFPGGYNSVLVRYGDWAKAQAPKYNATVADLNTPVVAMLQKANAMDAPLAQKILPDRVHPDAGGHLIMAEALLKAWNAPALVSRVEINAAGKKVTRTENAKVSNLTTGATVAWDEMDNALPFAVYLADPQIALVAKSSDVMEALNQQPLMVSGLDATKRYTLTIDGKEAGDFTGAQFAQGINLAGLDTPMMQQAKNVLALTRKHNDQHFERWRNVQVPFTSRNVPAITSALPPLLTALDAEEAKTIAQQRAAAQPVSHHFEIKTALPAPNGPNLAVKKAYTVSDPNNYGWGLGGLTDGSWEASPQHGFATGDTNAFPKHATVDLGSVSRIGTVIYGVPPFGSTKNVTVSVSEDGQNFKPVGTYTFTQRHEEKHRYTFPSVAARYVRLTYADHYNDEVDYGPYYGFGTELEVYAP